MYFDKTMKQQQMTSLFMADPQKFVEWITCCDATKAAALQVCWTCVEFTQVST